MARYFQRYVAIGDSSTEGLDDPDGAGGYRGWADRLAERLAREQGALRYANLGVRGRRTHEIRAEQLAPAIALRPDLATVFVGSNDLLERHFDAGAVERDTEQMQSALVGGGATVLTFTLPDLTRVMPVGRWLAPRVRALNDALRAASARSGTILVDFAAHDVGSDRRLWSPDRFHANAAGHARIAAALAHALELPGTDDRWSRPLGPGGDGAVRRALADAAWSVRYLVAWALHAPLVTPARRPKRPALEPVVLAPPGR